MLVLVLVLASGSLLQFRASGPTPVILLSGAGFLLLSAALSMLVQRRKADSGNRIPLYWICIGLVISVQLTGGQNSFFYSVYLLFLLWVSLPSVAGTATEFGLIIGLIESFSILNSSIWAGDDSFISRLIPLLLPALKALLVPFIFGLLSDWLLEREFSPPAEQEIPVNKRELQGKTSARSSPEGNAAYPVLQILHESNRADSTCLFLISDDGFFRLSEYIARDNSIISRFMLPAGHRLARMAGNSGEIVSIRADSIEERSELTPYRFPGIEDEGPLWILLAPFTGKNGNHGFLIQDFTSIEPSENVISNLEILSRILQGTSAETSIPVESEFSLMAKLVAACEENSLDKAVSGMAVILSELVPESTISIADVDNRHSITRVWVSRGPLAKWRRGRSFDSTAGMAGWIVKNRVPCRRSRMKYGEKKINAFNMESGGHPIYKIGSCLGVPIVRKGEVLALIMAEHSDDTAFEQRHEEIMLAVAGMFSMREELAGLRSRFDNISGKDTLTGLPGVTLLDGHLHHMAKEVQTYGWNAGVIVADIDGFDAFNRNLGYGEGDRLLVNTADRFRNCFSDDAFIARIGADSFAACIPRAGKAVMEAMCQRAADALTFEYSRRPADPSVRVSACIGGVYTHINRKVLLLIGEAERLVSKTSGTAPGAYAVRKLGLSTEEII